MFTAGEGRFNYYYLGPYHHRHMNLSLPPQPRSYIRIRLLHLGGPHLRAKRYALCNYSQFLFCFSVHLLKLLYPLPSPPLSQEGGVFTAKLTFVRRISFPSIYLT